MDIRTMVNLYYHKIRNIYLLQIFWFCWKSFNMYNHRIIFFFKNTLTHTSYRPWTIVIVTLLREHLLGLCWEEPACGAICLSVNAGCFGRGRSIVSLLSMKITTETVDLSLTNSCTHSSPTCMHLKISISKQGSRIIGSINATMLSAFHIFHAWKHENRIEILSNNTQNS